MPDLPTADAIPDDFRFLDDAPVHLPRKVRSQPAARQVGQKPQQPSAPQWWLLRRLCGAGYALAALAAVGGFVVGYRSLTASIEAGQPSLEALFGWVAAGTAVAGVLVLVGQVVSVLVAVERNTRPR